MSIHTSSNQVVSAVKANTMNRKRVIVWMTVAVVITLLGLTAALLGALPPWPVWLFFALSHGFFCIVVWKTQPFEGPHLIPMPDVTISPASKESQR